MMTNADKVHDEEGPSGNKVTEEDGINALTNCGDNNTDCVSASNNGYQCDADPPPYSLQSEPESEGSKSESCTVVTAIIIAMVIIIVVTGIPIYLQQHKCKHEQTSAMIDACLSKCDRQGGWCNHTDGYYFCQCNDGFNGTNCENNIDECASDPCQNAGKCVDVINGYVCQCETGYIGDNCQENIDECASDPCENTGVCVDLINGYVCHCGSGYEGVNCQYDIDECASDPCKNAGQCVDVVNRFLCICAVGYTGNTCQENIDECASDPCQNAGHCDDVINGYECRCIMGYKGVNCQETEERIDECYSETNGTDYRGSVSTTETGKTCQNWTSQTPHGHDYTPANYSDAGIGDHNYCRNPLGSDESWPWCYTNNNTVRSEYCDAGDPQSSCEMPCPDYWIHFRGECYRYFATSKTWMQANHDCMKLGANLVSIHSEAEENFVNSLTDGVHTWLGFHDGPREGSWFWSDGTTVDYTNWNANEPNNAGSGQDCAVRRPRARWDDIQCNKIYKFVCKM